MKTQKRSLILVWILVFLFILFGASFALAWIGYLPMPAFFTMKRPAPMPKPAETRDGRWGQAVEYLGSQLPYLHVDPYFKISEAEFQQSVAKLAEAVPDLNDEQIVVEMMRIVASIGDGHTRIDPNAESAGFARLPLEMRWLSDGLIVIAASPEHVQAVGAKVVRVGTHPVEKVYAAVKPLVAADNEMQILNDTAIYMGMPAILYGLDLIPQKDHVTFGLEAQDGSQFDLELYSVSGDPEPFISVYEKAGVQLPLYEQDRGSFYWFRELAESNAVYVQYNVCRNQKGKPFESFVDEVFDLLDRGQETRLVLDLRFNGGGNEAVLTPFIQAIEERTGFNEPGKLFVIIGRGTYSSALQNAITLSREYHATLIGEPTGGKPNHYGEVRNFDLPNVGLRVWYSTRYWLNYPEGDPLTLEPDVSAVVTVADLLAGRDPALEAAVQP
jgi:hypothetical protein